MDGTENQISVEQYFSQKYNVVLQYPALPAVQAGSDTKPIYLPMEVLFSSCVLIYSIKLAVFSAM